MQHIYLLTKNPSKLEAAQKAFAGYPFEIVGYDHEFEVQGISCQEIAQEAARRIATQANIIAIREDHALYIDGVFGGTFPGPYTAYFDRRCSIIDWIETLFQEREDISRGFRSGYFEVGTCIAFPDGSFQNFCAQVPVEITAIPSGNRGNLDKILRIPGSIDTFASMPPGTYTHLFTANFTRVAEYLSNKLAPIHLDHLPFFFSEAKLHIAWLALAKEFFNNGFSFWSVAWWGSSCIDDDGIS